jgi:uncharacterized protein YprB with RNaseH-like and TPR domain
VDVVKSEAAPANLERRDGAEGSYLVRESLHPPRPGFLRALETDPTVLTWLARDPRLAGLDPARSVFLDIETTSLGGGAGVHVFLAALGRLSSDGSFTLRQYFLGSPGGARPMLAAVTRDLAAASSVVTFFGKAFDRHRLEDQFRLAGLDAGFPDVPHADLYHLSRARFGWRLVNCKLRTVEAAILGIRREGDLPGSEAPQAYFDYLRGRPHPLEAVFQHNALDVLSLVDLLAACAAPVNPACPEECLAVSRGAAALGDGARARELALLARSTLTGGGVWAAATRELAELARLSKEPSVREAYLDELARAGSADAALALAKCLAARDPGRAAALLCQVRDIAAPLPPGRERDALLLGAAKLRRKLDAR